MTSAEPSFESKLDDVRPAPIPQAPPTRPELRSAADDALSLTPDRLQGLPTTKKSRTRPPKAKRCLVADEIASLQNPVTNSTRILEHKLAMVQKSEFDANRALESHLHDETTREALMRKSSKAVNVPKETVRYTNLLSLEVDESSLSPSPPMRTREIPSSSKIPQLNIMDFYTPDLETELVDWSVEVPLPSAEPQPLPTSTPYDFYRHAELWRTPPP